jgi:hypothetical protein
MLRIKWHSKFFPRWLWRVVWWDVTFCSWVVERCVKGTCCLHLQGWTRKTLTVVRVSRCLIFEPEYGNKRFLRNVHNLLFYLTPCHIIEDNPVAYGIPCRTDIFIIRNDKEEWDCNFLTEVLIKIIIVWMWRRVVPSMIRKTSEESLWIWRAGFSKTSSSYW